MPRLYTPTPLINYGRPVNWTAPLNRGLVAWWLTLPAFRGRGVWMDLTGSNLGTLTSMVASDWMGNLARPGGWGCLNFDVGNANTNQRVVTASNNLIQAAPYSIAMWIRSPNLTTSSGGNWFNIGNAGVPPTLSQRDTGGLIRWQADFNTTDLTAVASTALPADTWTHVIVTWTGGIDANVDVVFYVNGQDAGHSTGFEVDAVGTEVTKASTVKVIGNGNFSAQEAKAYIDDVRIYDRVITSSEAAMLYNATRTGYQVELNRIRRMNLNTAGAAAGLAHKVIGDGVRGTVIGTHGIVIRGVA